MKIWFWLKNSRLFSLPMTVLSWLVIFVYSFSGDKFNGFLALIGIAFAHLATNLFDDYVDYKNVNSQNTYSFDKPGLHKIKIRIKNEITDISDLFADIDE